MRLARGQQDREGVFVPSKDQAEDGGGHDAGHGLRQHHFAKGLQAGVAVDHGGLFVFARDLVNKALEQPDRERHVDRAVQQNHPEPRVREPQLPVHQVDGNRHGNRRHHARGQNEEQQIVFQRHLETRKRIGRHYPKAHRQNGGTKRNDQRVGKARREIGRAGHRHALAARDFFAASLRRWQAGQVFVGLARAGGEQVAVALDRGAEDDFGRVADRVGGGFEAGHDDPHQRDHGDQGVEHHHHTGKPLAAGGGVDHRMGGADTFAHAEVPSGF